MGNPADFYVEIYGRGMGGETPAVPGAGRGPGAPRPRDDGGAGGELRLRRGRDRGHDARQPRGLPPPPDRAPHAARRRRARPLDHRARHAAAGAAAARPDRRPEGRPRGGRAGDGAGGGGRRPADDRQHRLPLHDGGDRRGERRGAALVPALLAQRPRAARELRRPRRGRRLRRDRRHRRHLHPRLEAARPAAGLAALPRRQRQRQLLPGPGLPGRPRAAARGGPGRGDRPLPGRALQPRADLGRPGAAARADLAADPGQGDPARRRRPRGGEPRHRRDRRLQPRRPAGRRRARLARRAAGRSPTRSATSSRSSSTAASAAAPTSSRRSPSAPTPSASAAPTSGAWRSTARRGSKRC